MICLAVTVPCHILVSSSGYGTSRIHLVSFVPLQGPSPCFHIIDMVNGLTPPFGDVLFINQRGMDMDPGDLLGD